MNKADKILNTEYTLSELGRRTSLYRINHKLTQAELAYAVFESMKDQGLVAPEAEFKANVGRVTISKLEKGNRCPTKDFVRALINLIESDSKPYGDDPESSAQQYDRIIRELTIIVNQIPMQSAESLLFMARMIKEGSFNNFERRGY